VFGTGILCSKAFKNILINFLHGLEVELLISPVKHFFDDETMSPHSSPLPVTLCCDKVALDSVLLHAKLPFFRKILGSKYISFGGPAKLSHISLNVRSC
jgi:hypothetical protein